MIELYDPNAEAIREQEEREEIIKALFAPILVVVLPLIFIGSFLYHLFIGKKNN